MKSQGHDNCVKWTPVDIAMDNKPSTDLNQEKADKVIFFPYLQPAVSDECEEVSFPPIHAYSALPQQRRLFQPDGRS